jgi:hypothetical protein
MRIYLSNEGITVNTAQNLQSVPEINFTLLFHAPNDKARYSYWRAEINVRFEGTEIQFCASKRKKSVSARNVIDDDSTDS